MDPERWGQVESLFHEALERPEAERAGFLAGRCRGDPELRRAVERLLDEDARTGGPLDRGVAELADAVLDGAPLESVPPHGRTIGPFRLVEVLGRGGMGVVYLAEREGLGDRVALKVLRDASLSPARRERFLAEERTLAQLVHPSIARLYHADTLADGTPYFVMEYVEGLPLDRYCRERLPGLEARLRLLGDVCAVVDVAHRQAVIHRDLKPSNVLVDTEGTPRLLDFGIAKQLDAVDAPRVTRTGLHLMTPAYAAPEQVVGGPVGVYTDVYALGVMLYELLAGALPHDLSDQTPGQVERTLVEREPAPPSVRGAALHPAVGAGAWRELDLICATAMAKDPERRYRSAAALKSDLERFLGGEPLEARPPSGAYRLRKFIGRNRRALATAATVLGVLFAGALYYTVQLSQARDVAVAEARRTQRIQAFVVDLLAGHDTEAGPADSLRVVTVIERGVREARALDQDPAQQADLYLTLGELYRQLGRFSEADSLLSLAAERRIALFGGAHPEVWRVEVARAEVAIDRGEYERARSELVATLAAQSVVLERDDPEVARTRLAHGRALDYLGAYDEAIDEIGLAVASFEAADGRDADLAAALGALANAHLNAGHLEIADSLNRRTLALDRARYGGAHPTIAASLINLGVIEFRRGRYAEAEPHYREAVEILRGYYGSAHPETASALRLLGQDLIYQGRLADARPPLEEALAIQDRALGPLHPRLANTLGDLAYLDLEDGHLDAGVERYRRVLAIYRDALGDEHYFVAIAISNLASAYMDFERWGEAEPLFRDAVRRFVETRSSDDLDTGIARIKLGRVLARQGRLVEAEREVRAGYDIVSARSEPTVSWLRGARTELTTIYEALGRPDDARFFRDEQAAVDADAARAEAARRAAAAADSADLEGR